MHELDAIFRSQSIAVIGASQHPGKIGWEIVHNIIRYAFEGKLFPVNPNAEFVHSTRNYRNMNEIPDPVVLAFPKRESCFAVNARIRLQSRKHRSHGSTE